MHAEQTHLVQISLPSLVAVASFNNPSSHSLRDNSCTSCGLCDRACSMDISTVPENLRSAECIQCLKCIEVCHVPDTLELRLG